MTSPATNRAWDGNAVRKQLRKALANAEQVQKTFGEQLVNSSPDFYHLSLAELDAGYSIVRSACFDTRATFLAELRRLIAEPTSPSHPIKRIQAYRDGQKYWLDHLIKIYEQDA